MKRARLLKNDAGSAAVRSSEITGLEALSASPKVHQMHPNSTIELSRGVPGGPLPQKSIRYHRQMSGSRGDTVRGAEPGMGKSRFAHSNSQHYRHHSLNDGNYLTSIDIVLTSIDIELTSALTSININ